MADENLQSFLSLHPDDIKYFAEVDYSLRSGQHIQSRPHQHHLFEFIEHYENKGLAQYYITLFNIKLSSSGIDSERYFYLEAEEDSRSLIKSKGRRLNAKEILFGIFLLNVHRVEKAIAFEISINELLEIIKQNPKYERNVNRLFSLTADKNTTEATENTIEKWMVDSLREFDKLGWVVFDKDAMSFTVMPSLDRLFRMYFKEINDIDKLMSIENDATNEAG